MLVAAKLHLGGTRLALLLAIAWAVGACSPPAALAVQPPLPDPPLGPAAAVHVGRDEVILLRSGAATFDRIRAVIDGARSDIHLEMYEFSNRRMADAVIAAQTRGVRVQLIDDPSEASSVRMQSRLRDSGVDVLDYPVRKLMIDHVKLLVVDGTTAIVGGINWGSRSPANHDYDALIRGPAVRNLDRIFARDLVTCGRATRVPEPVVDPGITVAATLPSAEIRPLALDVLNQARRTLDLELFDLTDTGMIRALVSAHSRGVAVHVLLDPTQRSNTPSAEALRAQGVEMRWYRSHGELLHAKAVVADAATLLFGSANWSGGGFARNHEVDIEIPALPALAQQMEEQMSLDWNASAA